MSELPSDFRAFVVRREDDEVTTGIERLPTDSPADGDVVVQVEYSSLNYKDMMAAGGHPGVVKKFPHVPGIDAAGIVLHSDSPHWSVGDRVIATGHEIGVERFGGWGELIHVPAAWLVHLPEGFSAQAAMAYGTAGFTAVQCVQALRQNIEPDDGDVLVTGATGGVGSISVSLLAKLGYRVIAVSGKAERREWLEACGAADVLGRDELIDSSDKPLLRTRWAGAVDTTGGPLLQSIVRSLSHRGCVAACGVVAGGDLPLTVYPFILRGVTLVGIDSAWCPDDERLEIWERLAGDWRLPELEEAATVVSLDDLLARIQMMRNGDHVGRTVVAHSVT